MKRTVTIEALFARLPKAIHPVVFDMIRQGEQIMVSDADKLLPTYVRRYYGTDNIEGEALGWDVKNEDGVPARIGRCYELAWVAMANAALNNDLIPGTALVHGSIHGPEEGQVRMGHGWLEMPGPHGKIIWEPFTAGLYDAEQWTIAMRARHERSYTLRQALILAEKTNDTGRWHESRYP